ncbi:hypothetical protein HDV03_000117 [Kappamyces sp. JEL0829]|nr:hypothetical protein HDV03_000117 [Kappamyces sp. JEL0829]
MFRHYSNVTKDFVKQLAQSPKPKTFLIDVRNPEELAEGKIPTAISIPLGELLVPTFSFSNLQLSIDKTDEIVVYCRSGRRSAMAAEVLEMRGFKDVKNYEGSWLDWLRN